MRIYLAGPMTGLPNLNRPLFIAETARLRALGYDVVSPVEINAGHPQDWRECMRRDIAALVTCEAIAMLPEWMHSKGALIEYHLACDLGLKAHIAACLDWPLTALTDHSADANKLVSAHDVAPL